MAGERIATSQVMMLLTLNRITVALVYFPLLAVPDVRHDAWIVPVLSPLFFLPCVWVLNLLWQRFPRQTFFEAAERVLGRVAGKLAGLLYILFLLLALSLELRLVGEFFLFAILPRTPIIVVIGVVAFLAAWAARAGIEVIGRAGQMVFPLLVASIGLIFLLLLKDIQFRNLQPVAVTSGAGVILREQFNAVARNIELVWMGMLVPFVNERHGILHANAIAVAWTACLGTVMAVTVTGVLGPFQELLYFPFFAAARQVQIADFLERVDAVLLSTWLLGMFLRDALILWAAALGTARWLGLQEYRPLVLPLTGIAITYAIAQAESFSEVRGYLRPEVLTPFMFTFVWLIPVLVLAVAALRGVRGDTPAGGDGTGRAPA